MLCKHYPEMKSSEKNICTCEFFIKTNIRNAVVAFELQLIHPGFLLTVVLI